MKLTAGFSNVDNNFYRDIDKKLRFSSMKNVKLSTMLNFKDVGKIGLRALLP